jgi:hypothetical protein
MSSVATEFHNDLLNELRIWNGHGQELHDDDLLGTVVLKCNQ